MKYLVLCLSLAVFFVLSTVSLFQKEAYAFSRAQPTPAVTPAPKPTVTPQPTPQPTSTPVESSGNTLDRIQFIAAASSCARVSWKDRGRAPAGYNKGIALSFARSLCREEGRGPLASAAAVMSEADTGNDAKDAITHFASRFASISVRTDSAGAETLRAVYTLGLGLGMRESSGNYCEGYDVSASIHTEMGAEAGVFQASYDSMGASPELRKLYDEYRANPGRCFLGVFKEGASCTSQGIIGTGAGAEYQAFNKSCPAFAAEYTMVLLRVLRKHFGPINRLEVEVNASCATMLNDVERFVDEDSVTACRELFTP